MESVTELQKPPFDKPISFIKLSDARTRAALMAAINKVHGNAVIIAAKNFKRRKPSTDHWMSLSLGSSAYHLDILALKKRNAIAVELYINDDKSIFHRLVQHRTEIEKDIEFTLDWRELPDKKASRIIVERPVDLDNQNEWNSQFDWIMDTSIRFKQSFKKYI